MSSILAQGQIVDSRDFELSQQIAVKLNQHYPGYMWGVDAVHKTGIVQIQLMGANMKYGMELHISDINSDPGLRGIVIAGGEILERNGLTRGKFNEDKWRSAPRDFRGNLVGDHG